MVGSIVVHLSRDRALQAKLRAEKKTDKEIQDAVAAATGLAVGRPRLERDGPLSRRRRQLVGVEAKGDLVLESEAPQPGDGEHDAVELADLGEPRIDVAAQLDDLEIWAKRKQLRPAAQARGSDPSAVGDRIE